MKTRELNIAFWFGIILGLLFGATFLMYATMWVVPDFNDNTSIYKQTIKLEYCE